MILETDRQTLDTLLAPRPKVIFAETDHAAASALFNGHSNGYASLDYLVYRPASGATAPALRMFSHMGVESSVTPVPAPPSAVTVLAALTDAGHDQLREFVSWWSGRNAGPAPQVLDLRNGHASQADHAHAMKSALFQRLFEMSQADLHRADERVAELHGALYELRGEYEQARGVMRRIQQFLPQIAPFKLIESFPPSNSIYSDGQSTPQLLHQALPTSASGLAAIDLFSPPGAVGTGRLYVTLQDLETDAPIAIWRVSYDRLGQGWFRCAFPVASTSPARQVELTVRWETDSGEPPRLALSPVGAYPEMRCQSGDTLHAQCLAMYLWGTLPGTNLNLSARGWCQITGTPPQALALEYALDATDIARIRSTIDTTVNFIHPLTDKPGFRLHPMEGPASGMLRNICPEHADRVSCTVMIRNEQAQFPIEFALCATPVRYNCDSYPADPVHDTRVVGHSGWQTVPADQQPHAVTLLLDRPLIEPADLHFATRVKDSASTAFAWADWLEVRIRLRHEQSGGYRLPDSSIGDVKPQP